MSNPKPSGWVLKNAAGEVVKSWGGDYGVMPDFPNPIQLPNDQEVWGATGPGQYEDWTMEVWMMDEP